ncbi:DMT family transporter [Alteromonas gracilis]
MTAGQGLRFAAVGLIWGLSYPLVAVALQGLSPAQIALARMALALLVLGAVVIGRGLPVPRDPITWVHLAASAALGMVAPFLLIGYGQQHTGAATTGAIIAALPLITLVLAAVLLPQERAGARTVLAFAVAFVGVVLVIGPWRVGGAELVGSLAILGAATAYAAETVYIRRFLVTRGLPPLLMAAGQLATGLVVQVALVPATGWSPVRLTTAVVISVIVLGAVGTGLAYLFFNQLITEVGAARAASVNYLVPVVSAGGAVVLLGERLTWNLLVGGAVVLMALAAAERPSRRTAPAQALVPACSA